MGFNRPIMAYSDLTGELISSVRRVVSYIDQSEGDKKTPDVGILTKHDIEIDLHRLRYWLEELDAEEKVRYRDDDVRPMHLYSLGAVMLTRGVGETIPRVEIEKALEAHRLHPWGTVRSVADQRGFSDVKTLKEHAGRLHSNHSISVEGGEYEVEIQTRLSTTTFVFLQGIEDPDYCWY